MEVSEGLNLYILREKGRICKDYLLGIKGNPGYSAGVMVRAVPVSPSSGVMVQPRMVRGSSRMG